MQPFDTPPLYAHERFGDIGFPPIKALERAFQLRDKGDADKEEHDGNYLTSVLLQETGDGVENAVEISGRHGKNGLPEHHKPFQETLII